MTWFKIGKNPGGRCRNDISERKTLLGSEVQGRLSGIDPLNNERSHCYICLDGDSAFHGTARSAQGLEILRTYSADQADQCEIREKTRLAKIGTIDNGHSSRLSIERAA